MLADFLKSLVSLAREKDIPQKLETGKRNASTFMVAGQERTFEHDAPPRAAVFGGLDDLIAAVEDEAISPAPEVYHDGGGVRVLLDRAKRDEAVSLPLELTQAFSGLISLSRTPVLLDPKGMIRCLRNTFGAASPETAINAIRRIDFTRTSAGKSDVQHGRESLGRSVEAAVQQADQVPESFIVRTRVYLTPGVNAEVDVNVALWLDLEQQKIEVRVHGDEITNALQRAQARIHDTLVEALVETPIFYGKP